MATFEVLTSKVDQMGRVLLPAKVRKKLSLHSGSEVLITMKSGALELRTPEQAVKAAQDLVCSLVPSGVSLSKELIRERREEARRESKD